MGAEGEEMLGGLVLGDHVTSLEDLPGQVAMHAAPAGFTATAIYVTDLQQRLLVPLPGQRDPSGAPLEPERIDDSEAGLAFRSVELVRSGVSGPGERVWAPLLDGTERIGVLGLTVLRLDDVAERRVLRLASLLAVLLVSKRQASDTYACLIRRQPMELSAEVLWSLLPIRAFANERVVVSAALEPAYVVGGDAFDYAVTGDTLHLAVFDAMGHDTSAGLTATIAMGSYRNNRRQDADLFAAAESIDAAIADQFGRTRFATGILAALDTGTGELTWVNRGHHPPMVLRGGRVEATLETLPDPPMGFRLGADAGPSRYRLEPGDRLVFYTDGIVEAKSPLGEVFGLERFVDFIIRHEADGVTAPETLRRLIQAILDHQNGHLQDDATVMLVEWRTQQHQRLAL
ncbi:PP2C family protein-serine/threonine phosphatase [Nonomuraea sp. SBT364]|uniref:PP2C family protein-serine/threonine phosphatase n=1 Tax=Nonomuraea sp. SBT364 TaxID=1580530 RepID=UPI000A58F51E|nr:PP2C family protein-serine/threonine phosphatase [Nonomuraea sp. SBT364]